MELSYLSMIPIAIAIYLVTWHVWEKLQNRPPGPFLRLPVVGHLHVFKFPITDTYTELANRFGPILSLRVGYRRLMVVSSPSATEECLATNDITFCNRPQGSTIAKYMGYEYTSLNFAPYGARWKNLRKLSAVEILSTRRLQSLSGIRCEEVGSLISRLSNVGPQHAINIKPLLLDTTMNIMTRTILGKRYYGEQEASHENGKRVRQLLTDTVSLLNKDIVGDEIPYLRWLDTKVQIEFKEFTVRRDLLLDELIEEHRRSWDIEPKPDSKPLVQVLLELQESDPDYYTDKLIQSIIVDLLVGGSDTSANTMEWAFALLLNNPNVMKKAQGEIDNHVGLERLLDEADLSQLPYLRCIINETMRMYPAIPHLLPHEASKDCVVGGYRIPRGTMLQVNAYTIQNDPKYWGDPENYRPERFEGVEGHRIGYKMIPFGVGRRSCPGEGLAIRVIGLTIGSLIQCFDWERIDHNLVDMSKFDSFNLQRAKPLEAKIRPRQVMMNLLKKL